MKLALVEDWSEFTLLQEEWNQLLHISSTDTIFLTRQWIGAWAEVACAYIEPFVVTVRNANGVLVGLAPFYMLTYYLLKAVPYKVLRFMGDYASGAEYPDWLVAEHSKTEVYNAIANFLALSCRRWDCIWMPNVAGWTGASDRLLKACRHEGFHCHARSRIFSFFNLPKDIITYKKALSVNRRGQLNRQKKKVMESGNVRFVRCEKKNELPVFLEALFDLHFRRWKISGEEGSFIRRPDLKLFYRGFTPVALKNGWLRMFGLKVNGEFKAVQLGYVYNKIFFQLQEGFDPGFIPGVGNVLRYMVIEACIGEGVETYDFLGEMTEHKKRWSAKKRKGYDLLLGHRGFKNSILFYGGVWPTGRFLRPRPELC